MIPSWIRPLFVVAAIYDIVLGIGYIVLQERIFTWFQITPPNHPGYVMWGAAVVLIFGIGFALVARNPVRNRDLIVLGILFKLAYSGTVLGYQFLGTIPWMWVPWAYADLVFAALFIMALRSLPRPSAT
jgi:hypothetical protein